MPRQVKTQWDFGELFPPEAARRVLTVSELTLQIKRLLEAQIGSVWVSGEVSNLRAQASGHTYFTLKDAGAQLACVVFRGAAARREWLADGRKVLLQGTLTVYEPRGQYQLVVSTVELQGVGALQLAFEQLKQKLAAEGLFAPERKRPLPRYVERIGVVTSPTGAALRDVLHVIQRRHPALELVLAPCRVQGEGAATEIAEAIRALNRYHAAVCTARGPHAGLDLILVTRGGGSLEDLWAFNEEVVARAIFDSTLPVVSAVGHEIDFTISDFVADCRAATPSAAAELITTGVVSAREWLATVRLHLPRMARERHAGRTGELMAWQTRLRRTHPRQRVNQAWQRLDDLRATLARAARFAVRDARSRWEMVAAAWRRVHPRTRLEIGRRELASAAARLGEQGRRHFERQRQRLDMLRDRLRLLSPEQTLARGYSITTEAASGRIIREAAETRPGQVVTTRVHRGVFRSRVE